MSEKQGLNAMIFVTKELSKGYDYCLKYRNDYLCGVQWGQDEGFFNFCIRAMFSIADFPPYELNRYIFDQMVTDIRWYFDQRDLVWPDGQDAATFCAQEAMEMVDVILREKNYVRNHDKSDDTLGKEAAQTLMMLLMTCAIKDIDLLAEFQKLMHDL